MINATFTFSAECIWLGGVGYFKKPGLQSFFHSDFGLEIIFSTTLQNRKPKMPSPAHTYTAYTSKLEVYVYSIYTYTYIQNCTYTKSTRAVRKQDTPCIIRHREMLRQYDSLLLWHTPV